MSRGSSTGFAGALIARALLGALVYGVAAASALFAETVALPIGLAIAGPAYFAYSLGCRVGSNTSERITVAFAFGALALAPFLGGATPSILAVGAAALTLVPSTARPRERTDSLSRSSSTCPHRNYAGARAPSDYPNCRLIEGATFADIDALWRERHRTILLEAPSDPIFTFGGIPWTLKDASEGGIVVGNTGSGKTLLLKCVLGALAPSVLTALYDHKRTLYTSVVGAMPGGESEVALLNPTDRRGKAWDVARDVRSWLGAMSFASEVSRTDERESYWIREARTGIAALIVSIKAVRGDDWSGLDLIQASHPKRIRDVLRRSPEGQIFIDTALTTESRVGDRPGDVLATIASLLSNLLPFMLASEEHYRAGRRFSIREWACGGTTERCLILAHNPAYATAFETMNRALCATASAQLLAVPGRFSTPRAMFIVDELQAARALPIDELLTNGREKGVTVWLATQNLSGLSAALESRDAADALLGGVRSQAFLVTSDVSTAEKASALAGTQTFVRTLTGTSRSRTVGDSKTGTTNGTQGSVNRSWTVGESATPSVHTEKLIQPHTMRSIPPPGPRTGVTGFFIRDGQQWFATLDWRWVLAQTPERPPIADEDPVATDEIPFRPWTDEDFTHFLSARPTDDATRFLSDPEEG